MSTARKKLRNVLSGKRYIFWLNIVISACCRHSRRLLKEMKSAKIIVFVCGEAQTLEWSVLLLLLFFFFFLLALLSYYRIYTRYRKTYKNKSVDTSDIRYCAKFQPIVTSNFAKNRQKRLWIFWRFCVFCLFDHQNELKIHIWHDPPNIIWGCPIFFIL